MCVAGPAASDGGEGTPSYSLMSSVIDASPIALRVSHPMPCSASAGSGLSERVLFCGTGKPRVSFHSAFGGLGARGPSRRVSSVLCACLALGVCIPWSTFH